MTLLYFFQHQVTLDLCHIYTSHVQIYSWVTFADKLHAATCVDHGGLLSQQMKLISVHSFEFVSARQSDVKSKTANSDSDGNSSVHVENILSF